MRTYNDLVPLNIISITTYVFAFQCYPEMNSKCLLNYYNLLIICYVPDCS